MKTLSALLLFALLAAPDEDHLFRFRPDPDTVVRWKLTAHIVTRMEIPREIVEQDPEAAAAAGRDVDMTVGYYMTGQAVTRDSLGRTYWAQEFDSVFLRLAVPGPEKITMRYHSNRPSDDPTSLAVNAAFDPVLQARLVSVITDRGIVEEVLGFDDLLASMSDPSLAGALENFRMFYTGFPEGSVEAGESWSDTMHYRSSGTMLSMATVYTLREVTGEGALVDFRGELDIPESDLSERVRKELAAQGHTEEEIRRMEEESGGDFDVSMAMTGEATGELNFDPANGLTRRATIAMDLAADMGVMGMAMPMKIRAEYDLITIP